MFAAAMMAPAAAAFESKADSLADVENTDSPCAFILGRIILCPPPHDPSICVHEPNVIDECKVLLEWPPV